jgi:hypothetical protein
MRYARTVVGSRRGLATPIDPSLISIPLAVFLRLANALSALYARGSGEKRLLDAMLVAIPKGA